MAYNGDSKKIVSSSFLYTTLQSFYTKIKGLLDKKADKTALNSINPNTISGGYTKNSFYINTHPENSGVIIPFINNDLAFLLKRGGSAKVYYDGVEKSVDITNVFDGSPSYWAIDPTNIKEIIIELTLHKTFTWTNTLYVDFGSAGWRSKSIKIDVINTNNSETEWTNKSTITNNSIGEHKITFSHNDGKGFNKVRFTFSDWNSATIFRIACLGLVNYGSSGLRETFLPKDGGSVYGGITPHSNNSIDLGSSSSKWKNIYATTFNGALSGNATSATTASKATTLDGLTSTVSELNYCDGVTSNIQTQLNGKASSSHTHSYAGSSSAGGAATTALACTGNSATATNADKLDGYHADSFVKLSYAATTDWNTLTEGGMYRIDDISSQTSRHDEMGSYGQLLVVRGTGDTIFQLYGNYANNKIFSRTANGVGGTQINWTSWNKINDGGHADIANTATTSSYSNNLNSTGFGSGTLTYLQTSGDFYDNTGWCHYIIANHGDGATYYNHTIALPFWDVPMYQRQEGNTSSRRGWQKFYTTENITYGTSALTPGSSGLKTGHIYLQYE